MQKVGPNLKMCYVFIKLLEIGNGKSTILEDLVRVMDVKFDKYCDKGKYNMALVIATVYDSSKKMDFLDFFL
jgi:hypothetical protein